jgi:hypothetical protein
VSTSGDGVLVIDMLNAYRHEDAELLTPNVADIIDPLVGIISTARQRDVDHFDENSARSLVEEAASATDPGNLQIRNCRFSLILADFSSLWRMLTDPP